MEKIQVLVVGHGKLAEELLHGIDSTSVACVVRWDERDSIECGPCIIVHAGSGREIDAVVEFCTRTGSILLDLSTGESKLPDTPRFPVVICPNVNLQMLYFMAMVKRSSGYFIGQDIKISESHQASKSTKPGTAIYLARSLGLPENTIKSERDPKIQKEVIGIPSPFLDRHAYHQIVIRDAEVEIRLETRVLGKSAYASGLSRIIDIIAQRRLDPGRYDIVDLVIDKE
jgi:4-hydroxy-tetrahydrodipicolinate reductase